MMVVMRLRQKIKVAILVVLAIFVMSSCGGSRDTSFILITDSDSYTPYTLRVNMWAKDSYLAPFFSSFSINQDIDEFATTLASKNDQNGNQLITAVFQDTYILITQ